MSIPSSFCASIMSCQRPQRRRRPLPCIAAVEEQARAPLGAQLLHERCKVREAAELSVRLRRPHEVELGEGVRFAASGAEAEMLQESLADQMRRAVRARSDAEIDVRLAEMGRQQLGVAVGEVQERYVAEPRQIVESLILRARSQRKTGRGRGGERLQEFATRQRHLLTGDSGSSSSATRCVICSSVRTPLWPKRGMLEQAVNASE